MMQLALSARRASDGHAMASLARFGLAARAFVYLVIGWLAVQIARVTPTIRRTNAGR